MRSGNCARNVTSWQKPRLGLLGRPARSRRTVYEENSNLADALDIYEKILALDYHYADVAQRLAAIRESLGTQGMPEVSPSSGRRAPSTAGARGRAEYAIPTRRAQGRRPGASLDDRSLPARLHKAKPKHKLADALKSTAPDIEIARLRRSRAVPAQRSPSPEVCLSAPRP